MHGSQKEVAKVKQGKQQERASRARELTVLKLRTIGETADGSREMIPGCPH